MRRVGDSGVGKPVGAVGVEPIQPDIAAGLRNEAHAVAGKHGYVVAGDVRRITAEDPRTHAPRGGDYQNIPDRRVTADTADTQFSVGEILAVHIAEQSAQVVVGGSGHVLSGVPRKLHVQLHSVVAGTARLGADQLPAAHGKLLPALHDLRLHIAVAMGNHAHLHRHAARILQRHVPHGDAAGRKYRNMRCLPRQNQPAAAEINLKVLHVFDQHGNAVRTVETVVGNTQIPLGAEQRIQFVLAGNVEQKPPGTALAAGAKRTVQPQRMIAGNVKFTEIQCQFIHFIFLSPEVQPEEASQSLMTIEKIRAVIKRISLP